MLKTYLDQLQREADAARVSLDDACRSAGVAATTLARWRNGEVAPRQATAEAVLAEIRKLGRGRADKASDLSTAFAIPATAPPPIRARQ